MNLEALAANVGDVLKRRHLMLAIAESCTGGWVGQVITSIAGSSDWFDRGFITYTNQSKQELLGVDADILARYGAVSEQTARAMAEGVLLHSHAQLALAVTGIAGPSGGTPDKPVGTVWFAWAGRNKNTVSNVKWFSGDRESVRRQAVVTALENLLKFVEA